MLPRRHFIVVLILMVLPALAQAQFTFTTNGGSLTITGYTGPGGVVTIPGTNNDLAITGIGEGAFSYITNITSIIIPSSITNIGAGPFLGCSTLTNISVNVGNPSFSSSTKGVLFDSAQDSLINYPEGLTNGLFFIPYSVTNIGEYAFAYCSSLTNIYAEVNSIGEAAFIGCTGLASVTITNHLNGLNVSIGEAAFIGCTALTNVFVPGAVTNVGGLAFAYCTNLMAAHFQENALPDDGTAFYGDPGAVVYYVLGDTGWGATFGGAPTAAETTPPSEFAYQLYDGSITIMGYGGPGSAVAIPPSINGYPVTSIWLGAFQSKGITSIIIPNGVISIGQYVFQNCRSLTYAIIPSTVTNIGANAFYFCTSLTSISVDTANPSYSSLNGVLFDKAQDILIQYPAASTNAAYTIPNSVTSVENGAFESCANLTSAYFAGNAPSGVKAAFYYDNSALVVYYLPRTTGWGAVFGSVPMALWYQPQPAILSFEPSPFFGVTNNQFAFTISWATNASVVVQACTNLGNPTWIPVATNVLGNGVNYFSDAQWTNYPGRFYRVSGQ